MKHIEIIDNQLLDEVSDQAKKSKRLRMNYNFHQSLDEKCHRMLNALEPGTEVPIHRHPTKDETMFILRGKVKIVTYKDNGEIIDFVILDHDNGLFGVNIPKNTWHTLICIEPAVMFESKEGPFVPHEEEGILEVQMIESGSDAIWLLMYKVVQSPLN